MLFPTSLSHINKKSVPVPVNPPYTQIPIVVPINGQTTLRIKPVTIAKLLLNPIHSLNGFNFTYRENIYILFMLSAYVTI